MIAIAVSSDSIIRLTKKPLISVALTSKNSQGHLVCSKCFAQFTDIDEFAKHCKQENEAKTTNNNPPQRPGSSDTVPPNPIWWLSA